MPRPVKLRRVNSVPEITYFKPAGIPLYRLEETCLSVEEVEAIRLKDLEGLDGEECARMMKVSRPTFQRILESSRKKLADALLNGKAIRIEGGNFELASRHFRCHSDGYEWDVTFEEMISGLPVTCPACRSADIHPSPAYEIGMGKRCRRGWRRGQLRRQ